MDNHGTSQTSVKLATSEQQAKLYAMMMQQAAKALGDQPLTSEQMQNIYNDPILFKKVKGAVESAAAAYSDPISEAIRLWKYFWRQFKICDTIPRPKITPEQYQMECKKAGQQLILMCWPSRSFRSTWELIKNQHKDLIKDFLGYGFVIDFEEEAVTGVEMKWYLVDLVPRRLLPNELDSLINGSMTDLGPRLISVFEDFILWLFMNKIKKIEFKSSELLSKTHALYYNDKKRIGILSTSSDNTKWRCEDQPYANIIDLSQRNYIYDGRFCRLIK